ncbi:hypothetical protein ACFIJ5_18740 (plasmid) [Haloimpatiens sp. FM7330]
MRKRFSKVLGIVLILSIVFVGAKALISEDEYPPVIGTTYNISSNVN